MEFEHCSVLLKETIDNLKIKNDGIYVDGTLGGGGHSYEIAGRLGENGRLVGIDQDGAAIEAAGKRLLPFSDKVTIVRDNYCNAKQVLKSLGVEKVFFWIWGFPPTSWMLWNGDSPTSMTPRSICGWIRGRS